MKPFNIFLVRHGESQGNIDKAIYETIPDWKVPLTDKGRAQACNVAPILYPDIFFSGNNAAFYVSPWYRAKQTAEVIKTDLADKGVSIEKYHEDPRLREQDWGNYQNVHRLREIAKERDKFGTFFYRIENGESCADVFDRISTFLETLHRDFEKDDFPQNVVIVSHGVAIRVFLMRYFHWKAEEFELLHNPKNCQIYRMTYHEQTDKYMLTTPMEKRLPKT